METILLQVNSNEVYKLIKDLEALKLVKVLGRPAKAEKSKLTIQDFVGILSKKEATEMRKAIAETCETVDENDWK